MLKFQWKRKIIAYSRQVINMIKRGIIWHNWNGKEVARRVKLKYLPSQKKSV